MLPASLQNIEESAFEGSGFTYVRLPENTKMIGSRAFAGCKNLKYIYIPGSVTLIAADAFDGVESLTIYGNEGSYAEFYSSKKGYVFHDAQ